MADTKLDAVIAAHGFLDPNDPVAISFWIISIAMVAATVFFLMESTNVGHHWKTSMNVGALVTWSQRFTISTCVSSGCRSVPPQLCTATSIGRSQFLCRWLSSILFCQ